MQLVTTKWLFERGGLHDARVLWSRHRGSSVEVGLDDEWANERGLSRPEKQMAPGTMIISLADVLAGDLSAIDGGWISEFEMDDGELRLIFCDRDPLTLATNSVAWASAA